MILTIDRAWKKQDYTLSRLFINGTRFGDGKHYCSVLEDKDRGLVSSMALEEIKKLKVAGSTAIPAGVYEIRITYSPRFHRHLPLLLNVPGYDGVRIHPGNTHKDTEGCLLPGLNNVVGKVTNSRYWFNKLYDLIEESLGERVYIEVGKTYQGLKL